MSNRPVSKSTKRRRFLEEVEFVDNLYSLDQSPSTSMVQTGVGFEYMQENPNPTNCLTSNTSEAINSFPLPIVSFFDSNSSLIDESELHFVSDSDSDEEDDLKQFNFFADDKQKILNLLSQWAVSNNITNSALSALLKILKSHKCFVSFPSDARTILKTNLSCNNANSIQSVPSRI